MRIGTRFLIKPNPLSDVLPLSIHSIALPLRKLHAILAASTETPFHVHLSPTLRQNWSPRAQAHSALTNIRAANSLATLLLLRVGSAHRVVVGGMI